MKKYSEFCEGYKEIDDKKYDNIKKQARKHRSAAKESDELGGYRGQAANIRALRGLRDTSLRLERQMGRKTSPSLEKQHAQLDKKRDKEKPNIEKAATRAEKRSKGATKFLKSRGIYK